MENPVYEITKSFSRTLQIRQYEPAQFFTCVKRAFYELPTDEEKQKAHAEMEVECRAEIANQITKFREELESITKASEPF